jgi:hypothetical protein
VEILQADREASAQHVTQLRDRAAALLASAGAAQRERGRELLIAATEALAAHVDLHVGHRF